MKSRSTYCDGITRREVLRIGSAGVVGLTLPNVLRLEAQARAAEGKAGAPGKRKATSVILVNLSGGPATIDMWDLKPEAPDGVRGEFKPISTRVEGVRICEHMPRMAKMMDKVTLVRSLAHTLPVHGLATTWMFTGNLPTPVLRHPHFGSLAARLLRNEKGVPPFVAFGGENGAASRPGGYLGPGFNPFIAETGSGNTVHPGAVKLRGISLPASFPLKELEDRDRLRRRFDRGFEAGERASDLVDGLDSFHTKALELLRSEKTRNAFNVDKERKSLLESYGLNPSGLGLIVARRLVEAGVRFVDVNVGYQGVGGWDTHANNFTLLKDRHLPVLDRALSTLLQDLDDRGLLDTTIVYCCGEMGRTPQINKAAGRDHWARAQAVLLAGGGFKRGVVHGSTDAKGMDPATGACSPDDLAATIFHCLGLDPRQELTTPTGRAVKLFREGKVLQKILG